jgi:hypothetical protein
MKTNGLLPKRKTKGLGGFFELLPLSARFLVSIKCFILKDLSGEMTASV